MNYEIVKTKRQIQNKWDLMLCRWFKTKMRLKESYYEIARFATGERFEGSRRDLHVFVVGLQLERFVEIMPYSGMSLAKDDFKAAIKKHCKKFISDCYDLSPLEVMLQIETYKWKDLAHKRVMLKERFQQTYNNDTFTSKSGAGKSCSDWKTVK